jgi:hypothetical protein
MLWMVDVTHCYSTGIEVMALVGSAATVPVVIRLM